MKQCTVLGGLTEEKWTERHHEQIRDFLLGSSQVLLAYIDPQSEELTLCCSLPPFQLDQVAFFVMEEKVEVTSQNFHQVVQMGTVQGSYVDTLLRVMHGLYAPMLFENKTWPDSILWL